MTLKDSQTGSTLYIPESATHTLQLYNNDNRKDTLKQSPHSIFMTLQTRTTAVQ